MTAKLRWTKPYAGSRRWTANGPHGDRYEVTCATPRLWSAHKTDPSGRTRVLAANLDTAADAKNVCRRHAAAETKGT